MATEVMDFDCEMKVRGTEFSEDSELEIELESDEALERNENVESFPLFSSVAGLVCLVCCLLVTSLGLKEVT